MIVYRNNPAPYADCRFSSLVHRVIDLLLFPDLPAKAALIQRLLTLYSIATGQPCCHADIPKLYRNMVEALQLCHKVE